MNLQQQGQDDILLQNILTSITEKFSQPTPDSVSCTIFRFPNALNDIDNRIRIQIKSPELASFGPWYRGKYQYLLPQKYDFLNRFLSRTACMGRDKKFYVEKLMELKERSKRCYSHSGNIIDFPVDDDFVEMMLVDGCFMVELFRKYHEEGIDVKWPLEIENNIQTLIADLLKLENQLPFFVLQELFNLNNNDQPVTPTLSTLALRFLNQAFCSSSSDVVNSQIQHPKHLLDLFHSTLLLPNQTYTSPSKNQPLLQSIQSVTNLRSAGIRFRQKTSAKSLLEIDFRRLLHIPIPPYALKIPPVAIDDFTSTILVNCVAFEQCFQVKSRYFSAYVCFMNCLMQKTEDVEILRSSEIITRVLQDESCFRDMLKSVGRITYYRAVQGCYLWKQFGEIHDYYNSCWASIWRILLHNSTNISYIIGITGILVSILGWSWLFPENNSTASTSSAPSPK